MVSIKRTMLGELDDDQCSAYPGSFFEHGRESGSSRNVKSHFVRNEDCALTEKRMN